MKIKLLLIVLKMKNKKKISTMLKIYKLSLMKERVSKEIDLVRSG